MHSCVFILQYSTCANRKAWSLLETNVLCRLGCDELTVKCAILWFMTMCSLGGGTDFCKELCVSVFREKVRTNTAVTLEPGELQSKLLRLLSWNPEDHSWSCDGCCLGTQRTTVEVVTAVVLEPGELQSKFWRLLSWNQENHSQNYGGCCLGIRRTTVKIVAALVLEPGESQSKLLRLLSWNPENYSRSCNGCCLLTCDSV